MDSYKWILILTAWLCVQFFICETTDLGINEHASHINESQVGEAVQEVAQEITSMGIKVGSENEESDDGDEEDDDAASDILSVISYRMEIGGKTILICSFSQNMEFYKVKKGEEQYNQINEILIKESSRIEVLFDSLVIENITSEDLSYDYVCKSKNDNNQTQSYKFSQHPFVHPLDDSLVSESAKFTKIIGSFVIIEFKGTPNIICYQVQEGNGQPRAVEFERTERNLTRPEEKCIQNRTCVFRLKLNNLRNEHAGNYTCKEENEFGVHYFKFQLSVKGYMFGIVPFLVAFGAVACVSMVVFIAENWIKRDESQHG